MTPDVRCAKCTMPLSRDEDYVILPTDEQLIAYHPKHFKEFLAQHNLWDQIKIRYRAKSRIKKESKFHHFLLVLFVMAAAFIATIKELLEYGPYDDLFIFMLIGFAVMFVVLIAWGYRFSLRSEAKRIAQWEELAAELWGR